MKEESKYKHNESVNKSEDLQEGNNKSTDRKEFVDVNIKDIQKEAEADNNENVKDNCQIEEESKNLLEEDKALNKVTCVRQSGKIIEQEEIKGDTGIHDKSNDKSKARLQVHQQDMMNVSKGGSQSQIVNQAQLLQQPYGSNQNQNNIPADSQIRKISIKFSEALLAEKQRKFKRVTKVFGKRTPQQGKCPNCNKEAKTKLKHECTGNQWCTCIVLCFFGLYPVCCVPFCVKRCYNIKHLCPDCHYQIGESGATFQINAKRFPTNQFSMPQLKNSNSMPKPLLERKFTSNPFNKPQNVIKPPPPVDYSKLNPQKMKSDMVKLASMIESKCTLNDQNSVQCQNYLYKLQEELASTLSEISNQNKELENLKEVIREFDEINEAENSKHQRDNLIYENLQFEISTDLDEIGDFNKALDNEIEQVIDIDRELEIIGKDLDQAARDEYHYYLQTIQRKELINHSVKKGPFMIAIFRESQNRALGKDKKINYISFNNHSNEGGPKKSTWHFDKLLHQAKPLIDKQRDPVAFLQEVIFRSYKEPQQDLPQFQNLSLFCFGNNLFDQVLDSFEVERIISDQDKAIVMKTTIINERKFNLCRLSISDEFIDKTLKLLTKIKLLSFKLQKNDQKYYLVDQICKEIAKDCKETYELLKIYATANSQILFLIDLDEALKLPKEFQLTLMQIRKYKFQLY